MKLGITGVRSAITQAFIPLYDANPSRRATWYSRAIQDMPLDLDDYLLCAGVLHGKRIGEMTGLELSETMSVNFASIASFCDRLFDYNDKARVCVIGSQSGVNGSYDMAYAGAKAALHLYVETKALSTIQQHLVCVAPTIIEDAGMTQRRGDLKAKLAEGKCRRLRRWLKAEEVARIALFALKEPALCNTVINASGGNW